jgi:sulfoxide reductase heme-binding subunit YedZ
MNNPLPARLRVFLLIAVGAWIGVALPGLIGLVASKELPLMWWGARALGLVAQLAMWMSVLFGVFVGAKGAGGVVETPWVRELHLRWSLASIVLVALHVLFVVTDPFAGVGPWAALIPMASPIRTQGVALGTFAMLGMAGVYGATTVMKRLPPGVWRAVHGLSFGVFLLALLHGLEAGTDASDPAVRGMLLGSAVVVAGAAVQRVLLARATLARA